MKTFILETIQSTNSRIEVSTLEPSVSLLEQGLDSLDVLGIYMKVESEVGKPLPIHEMELITIEQIVRYLESIE